jgi:release factor glutamine methyltransferase
VSAIFEHVGQARQRLRAAGISPDEADLDARLLAEHVLGWSTERYLIDARSPATPQFVSEYDALVERRAKREPAAYIVGWQEFWGLPFEVGPGVLIPRPETELVVETALTLLNAAPLAANPAIADVCTGSGCVAVAIARERPDVRVTATDISERALAIARRNAERHGVAARVTFVRADLLAGVAGPFDLVSANPPYVPDADRPTLQPEVRDHEPPLALYAGADGLDVIRRLVVEATERLREGGVLVFEFGFGQSDEIAKLISGTRGLRMVELRPDLQGIPRVAVARKTRA